MALSSASAYVALILITSGTSCNALKPNYNNSTKPLPPCTFKLLEMMNLWKVSYSVCYGLLIFSPITEKLTARLDRLHPLRSAFHDSHGAPKPCEAGTYNAILSDISSWMDNGNQSKNHAVVYVVYGSSRYTTSAIAQSIAIQAHNQGQLLTSFFFAWKGSSELCDVINLVPTLMYGTANFDKDYKRLIAHAINSNPDIRDKGVQKQISVLLKGPFKKAYASSHPPLLVVIDALDACNQLDDPDTASNLALLIQTWTLMPFRIKVLITCRFTQIMDRITTKPGFPIHQTALHLHCHMNKYQNQLDFAAQVPVADRGTSQIH
jgi:hypothetical protein